MTDIRITNKQKEILYLLLKFRFLTTHQLQVLLGHKNANGVLAWLKDLQEKKLIKRIYERNSFLDNTKPAIYYLAPKTRQVFKQELDVSHLDYIYKEHKREKKFINHCLFLADIYLFFITRQEKDEQVKFFTRFELSDYPHFPDPLPDAFVAFQGKETRRFFLDFYDETTPAWVMRKRIRKYLEYAEESEWDEKTNFLPLPKILLICPTNNALKHLTHYSRSLLEKTYDDKVQLFLTTKSLIQLSNTKDNVWIKVEI